MFKFNLAKGIVLGMCFSLLSTGVALAAEVGRTQASEPMPVLIDVTDDGEPGDYVRVAPDVNNPVYLLQREIDQYVFTTNADELYNIGFKVAYTGPADAKVEIGINPYKEEYANHLYDVFGKDKIVVVDAELAYTFTTMTAPDMEEGRFVGDDIQLADGEFGITSIDLGNAEDADRFVGDDMQLADGEFGITSVDFEVDKSAEVSITSVEITSADEEEEKNNSNMMLIFSILGGVAVLGGGGFLLARKK